MNRRALSEGALAVDLYTDEIIGEHNRKGGKKIFSLGTLRLYECPLSYIKGETREIMRLCILMDEVGLLLYGGGLGDQPMWLIEAYEIYKSEVISRIRGVNNERKKN